MKRIWIISIIIVILLWSVNLIVYLWSAEDDIGKFGDVFGAVNSLFSGLAFAGIIISILMQSRDLQMQNKQLSLQSKELKLQRKELKLQREEQEQTRNVFKEQSKLMDDQRNDATFFNLLANHRQMIDSLRTSIFKMGRGGGRNRNNIEQEPVSGYRIVDQITNDWINRFELYSEMYSTEEISEFEKIPENPLNILTTYTVPNTIFDEILNIYDFVNHRFENHPQKQFYIDTLWTNLSYAEKFIFESYLYNFKDKNIHLNHKTDIYESYKFIDFINCTIPEISVRTDDTYRDKPKIKIEHNAKIVKVNFFTYKRNIAENSAEIIKLEEIKNLLPELPLEIVIQDLVVLLNDQIEAIPYNDSKKLLEYDYGIFCQFIHEGKKFKVCFRVQLTSQCLQSLENETQCYPIFNGNGIQHISEEFRKQLYSQLKI